MKHPRDWTVEDIREMYEDKARGGCEVEITGYSPESLLPIEGWADNSPRSWTASGFISGKHNDPLDLVPKTPADDWRDQWEDVLDGGVYKIHKWLAGDATVAWPYVAVIRSIKGHAEDVIKWDRDGNVSSPFSPSYYNLVPKKPAPKLHRFGDLKPGTPIKKFNSEYKRGEAVVGCYVSPDDKCIMIVGDTVFPVDPNKLVEIWDD